MQNGLLFEAHFSVEKKKRTVKKPLHKILVGERAQHRELLKMIERDPA